MPPITLTTPGLRWITPEGHLILPENIRVGPKGEVAGAKAVLQFEFDGNTTPAQLISSAHRFRGPVSLKLEDLVTILRGNESPPSTHQAAAEPSAVIPPINDIFLRNSIDQSAMCRQNGQTVMRSWRLPPELFNRVNGLAKQLGVPVVSVVDGLLAYMRTRDSFCISPLTRRDVPSQTRNDLGIRVLKENADWLTQAANSVAIGPTGTNVINMPMTGLLILLLNDACDLLIDTKSR